MQKYAILGLLATSSVVSVLMSFMRPFEPTDMDLIFSGAGYIITFVLRYLLGWRNSAHRGP